MQKKAVALAIAAMVSSGAFATTLTGGSLAGSTFNSADNLLLNGPAGVYVGSPGSSVAITPASGISVNNGATTINGSAINTGAVTTSGNIQSGGDVGASGLVSGGALSITGSSSTRGITNSVNGLNNSNSGITNSGAISGVTTLQADTNGGAANEAGTGILSVQTNSANIGVVNSGGTHSNGISMNPTSTTVRGGSNSAVLTLQDGNAAAVSGIPAGTSLTISGGAAGSGTSTVLQVTSAPDGSAVNTKLGADAADSTTTIFGGGSKAVFDSTGVAITGNTTVTGTTTSTGLITGQAGLTVNGGAANINASGTGATNIGTGATSGNVTIGGAANQTKIVSGTSSVSVSNGGVAVSGGTNSLTGVNNSITATSTNTISGATNNITGTSSTAVSGGGTSATLDNNGVTFGSGPGNAPVTVTGVANGVAPYDAVNVQQLHSLERMLSGGIASSTAVANIPPVDAGKTYNFGVGLGNYNSQSALAVGGSYRFAPNGQARASLASGLNSGAKAQFGIGAGWSW